MKIKCRTNKKKIQIHELDTYKYINPFMPTVPTFAVRETAAVGIMGAPRVPPENPSETIVL